MTTPDDQQREALADWLGAMPEASNVFDITDEATTVLVIDVEELARRLADRQPKPGAVTEAMVGCGYCGRSLTEQVENPGQAAYHDYCAGIVYGEKEFHGRDARPPTARLRELRDRWAKQTTNMCDGCTSCDGGRRQMLDHCVQQLDRLLNEAEGGADDA